MGLITWLDEFVESQLGVLYRQGIVNNEGELLTIEKEKILTDSLTFLMKIQIENSERKRNDLQVTLQVIRSVLAVANLVDDKQLSQPELLFPPSYLKTTSSMHGIKTSYNIQFRERTASVHCYKSKHLVIWHESSYILYITLLYKQPMIEMLLPYIYLTSTGFESFDVGRRYCNLNLSNKLCNSSMEKRSNQGI